MTNGSYTEVVSAVGPAENSTHSYKVEYIDSKWEGKVDDAVIATRTVYMSPDSAQYYNETDESIFTGDSSNKLKFEQPRYKDGTGTWVKPSLSFRSDSHSDIDHSNYNTGDYWHSWDSRY